MEVHGDARAVELAREGEARFRLLVEHSSDGLYLIGPDGHVSYASPPVERLLGFERRELTGRHFLDYLHPDDHDSHDVLLCIGTNSTVSEEKRMKMMGALYVRSEAETGAL